MQCLYCQFLLKIKIKGHYDLYCNYAAKTIHPSLSGIFLGKMSGKTITSQEQFTCPRNKQCQKYSNQDGLTSIQKH